MDLKNPTRTEALLANIAGHTDVPVPDMKNATRSERLLKEILDNGGGGGGGVTKEYVDNAIADAVADIDDDISALSDTVADKVDKVSGKSLSTNDYTDADKALVQDSPITVTATTSPISTSSGNLNALTVYGKSEVVDGAIKSAGDRGSISIRTEDRNSLEITATTQTINGVTFTVNPDNTITVNGTATATARLNITQYTLMGRTVRYLSGATINGSISTIRFGFGGYGFVTTANTAIALNRENTDTDWTNYVYIEAAEGYTANNVLFKPMISYTDDITYVPYSGSTMATFTTGTPLRGIPDTSVRDVMTWNGSAGEVTKVCAKVRLADLTWSYRGEATAGLFSTADLTNYQYSENVNAICAKYNYMGTVESVNLMADKPDKTITLYYQEGSSVRALYIKDTDYTTAEDFTTALGDAELVYELATPTTQNLTSTENASIAALKTFAPQTHAQNNAGATMTVEAYAGTANGKAVNELKQDVQSEISALKITQSNTLTLTTSGWTNNAQTITYEHDTGKRNTIDVEPASIKAWTAAGILATAETASTITFECDTVPTTDLSFRVTSMEVR